MQRMLYAENALHQDTYMFTHEQCNEASESGLGLQFLDYLSDYLAHEVLSKQRKQGCILQGPNASM
jgi:hypothetical protein